METENTTRVCRIPATENERKPDALPENAGILRLDPKFTAEFTL